MKKFLLVIGILAIAAVMSSCGGNASNTNAPADQKTTTDAKCSDKCSDQCKDKENCPNKDNCTEKPCADKPATTSQAVDLTKKYVCPNRDGSSDQPGVCEACGMDLIEN